MVGRANRKEGLPWVKGKSKQASNYFKSQRKQGFHRAISFNIN